MNIESLEISLIEKRPKSKYVRKLLCFCKKKHVTRYSMKKTDTEAIEKMDKQIDDVLPKYRKRWSKHIAYIESSINTYMNSINRENQFQVSKDIKEDIIFCRLAYGFMPDEYFAYDLLSKNATQRKSYISDRDRLFYIYNVNDIIEMDVVRNKNLTYKKFKTYYRRDAISITNKTTFFTFNEFVTKHPMFVKKNVRRNCGQGVELVNINEIKISKENYLDNLICDDEYILEERIIQSLSLANLHPSSINTVRCVTLIKDNGEIIIDHCFLKVGRNNSFLDNGAAGGLLVGIDKITGKLNTNAYSEFLEMFTTHPNTNIAFDEYQLPEWKELLDLAREVAQICPSVRFVGWDFAHTDNGWVLVEGNGRSQLVGPQLLYGCGLKQHFTSIMKIKD